MLTTILLPEFFLSAPTFSTQMDAQEAAEAGVGSWSGISRVSFEWEETAKAQLGFYHVVKCSTISSQQLSVGGFKAFLTHADDAHGSCMKNKSPESML